MISLKSRPYGFLLVFWGTGARHHDGNFYLVHGIKPPILISPIFSPIFSQFEQLKKKTSFYWSKTGFSYGFGPMKSLISFSTAQTEKNSWKKLWKTKLVVWWIDVTNNGTFRPITIQYSTAVLSLVEIKVYQVKQTSTT